MKPQNQEVTVRVAQGDDGMFIARAVDCPGAMTYGNDIDVVMAEMEQIVNGIYEINEIKNMTSQAPANYRPAIEKSVHLQVA